MKECSTLNTSLWCGWGQRSCCFLEYSVKNVGNYLWHLENWPWRIQQADKNKLLPACPDRVDNQMSTWCLHSKHQIKRTLRRGSWRGCRQSEWWSPKLLLLCALPLRNCIPHQYTSLLSGADFCSPNKWHCSLKTRLAGVKQPRDYIRLRTGARETRGTPRWTAACFYIFILKV